MSAQSQLVHLTNTATATVSAGDAAQNREAAKVKQYEDLCSQSWEFHTLSRAVVSSVARQLVRAREECGAVAQITEAALRSTSRSRAPAYPSTSTFNPPPHLKGS